MPRKKKDDFEKLLDALDGEELTKNQLQVADRLIRKRFRDRAYVVPPPEEVEHAGEVSEATEVHGGGSGEGEGGQED
jgi:hypothetical protein